jgi:hypothetical protein
VALTSCMNHLQGHSGRCSSRARMHASRTSKAALVGRGAGWGTVEGVKHEWDLSTQLHRWLCAHVRQTKQTSCGENGGAAHVRKCWVLELATGVFPADLLRSRPVLNFSPHSSASLSSHHTLKDTRPLAPPVALLRQVQIPSKPPPCLGQVLPTHLLECQLLWQALPHHASSSSSISSSISLPAPAAPLLTPTSLTAISAGS